MALAGSLWLLDRQGVAVAAPGVFLLMPVVFSTWRGGLWWGYASAVIAIAAGMPILVEPGHFLTIPSEGQTRIELLVVLALALPPAVWAFRLRGEHLLDVERRTRKRVEVASRELLILQAALDNVDYGVLLLDEDLRARFINRASRQLWNMPDTLANSRPPFIELMRHACDTGAFALRASKRDAYVDWRVALVRAGDETPMDLHLADGKILRFQCKALPAGGRFLSYTDVTDLVRHAEKLERLATTDEMTGICNRRHFLALAEKEWERFQHDHDPFALLILDVDLFKSINDRFGHSVGDVVIKYVVDICHDEKRDGDILARIGGEEFVLMLPKTGRDEAIGIAEKLRQRVEAEPFCADGESLTITVSIGVAEADAGMTGIGSLMKCADQALYDAKRGGRNRVKSRSRQPAPTAAEAAAA
ncbi:MAG TPA: diguanylate cyclase [Xanthobacteraceae bacterium]|jgi:diguanylate cyclase (GGDEF)-like protein